MRERPFARHETVGDPGLRIFPGQHRFYLPLCDADVPTYIIWHRQPDSSGKGIFTNGAVTCFPSAEAHLNMKEYPIYTNAFEK